MTSNLRPGWQNLKTGGDFRTPLSDFTGKVVRWETRAGQFNKTQIAFNFDQVAVIDSDTFYPQSTAEIVLNYSEQENSVWGIFGASAAAALGIDIQTLDIDFLVNQSLHMVREDNYLFFTDKAGKENRGTVWRITEIMKVVGGGSNGAPAATATAPAPAVEVSGQASEIALDLLDGQDLAGFFQVALNNDVIKADPVLVGSIANRQFVASMIQAGRIVEENGIYKKAS